MVLTITVVASFTILLILAVFRARKMNKETSRLDMHKSNLKKQSIEMVVKKTSIDDQDKVEE